MKTQFYINIGSTYNTYHIFFPDYVDPEVTSVGVTISVQCEYFNAQIWHKSR